MTNRQTHAHARGSDGTEVALQSTQSDAPLLPISSIERLHALRPDRVDWVFEQTEAEAVNRRAEQRRVNRFEFIERLLGLIFAVIIGLSGIFGGIYAALQGHDWLGGIVATTAIGSLAIGFLKGRRIIRRAPVR